MKQFTILWFMGMAGVLSILGSTLPIPLDQPLPMPLWAIKVLTLVQPTILLTLAVAIGVTFAHRVGLSAPGVAALSKGTSPTAAIMPQVLPGVVGGLIGGAALVLIQAIAFSFLPDEFVTKAVALSDNTSVLTRLLYGGITEEILLRWGLMTLLVWSGWRFLSNRQGQPSSGLMMGAIALSALLFGIGHLPLAFALGTSVTPAVIAYILMGNSAFGLIAGYLYWQRGLESAMLAHMLVHGVLVTAKHLGWS